ncbi:TetR/AcrR family transcriptional regulator [Actinocorallia sp. B10E7]|uniref:TetR/AcrR family transcriptional regulator n=1 Tax=Actinocorallia sp. B10E7 TaxID=3153558 RepID=UPI00325EDADD
MTGRREQNRRETRARVLDAAKKLFLERGVEGTTAVDLASAARISRATFFNYFGTKDDLLLALWQEQVGNLGSLITQLLARPAPTEERILLLFTDLVEAVDRRPGYLAMVAFELERAENRETTAVRSALFHEQLRRIIDAGLEQGDVRTDYGPALLTEMVGAVYLSVLRHLRLESDYDLRAHAPEAGRFIAGTMATRRLSPKPGPGV